MNEAGSFTEAFTSDEGSIGDDDSVGINESVLKRETSHTGLTGRASSPGANFRLRQLTMFGAPLNKVYEPSTPRRIEPIA